MSALPNPTPNPRRRSKSQSDQLARRRQQAQNKSRFKEERSTAAVVNDYAARIWESGFVVGINTVLIGTALVTFANLVPNQLNQRAKLNELRREESQVAQNLQELQQTLQRSQSPETAQRIAQEQGSLMRADQLKVFQIPEGTQKVQ